MGRFVKRNYKTNKADVKMGFPINKATTYYFESPKY